jgi:3-keto-disaccharide hydrolase
MGGFSRRWIGAMVAAAAGAVVGWTPLAAGTRKVEARKAETRQPKGKTVRLFNGRDLTNFYTWLVGSRYEDPERVFRVETIDGVPAIRVTGKHYGAFITRQEFSDYHLVTEFSWGRATWGGRKNATKDSGILLHCQGPDGNTARDFNGPWMLSQECQIIQGGVGDFILVAGHDKDGNRIVPRLTVPASKDRDGENIYDPSGKPTEFQGGRINWFGRDPDWRDVLGFRGKQDVESPGQGWTRVEVICDGDRITNIVNGTVVNAGTNSSLTRGKIIFQSEGAEIYFRKIDLTPLRRKG